MFFVPSLDYPKSSKIHFLGVNGSYVVSMGCTLLFCYGLLLIHMFFHIVVYGCDLIP